MWKSINDQEEIGLSKIDGDGVIDSEAMESLKKRYQSQSTATNITMLVPKPKSETQSQPQGNASGGSRVGTSSSASQQQSLASARGIIVIPGWVRESALEVLFEEGDEDESSITEVVLDCILSVSKEHPREGSCDLELNVYISFSLSFSAPRRCSTDHD